MLETETATIYLSLRSLISDATVDCTQHYISVLDDWNVAILLLLLHILEGENRGCQKRWHKKENNIARNEDFVDFGKAHKFAHYANDILSNLVGYCKNIYYEKKSATFTTSNSKCQSHKGGESWETFE